jgi:DNA-binding beta-propeller fold protein YncE
MSTLRFSLVLCGALLVVSPVRAQVVLDHFITLDDGDAASTDEGFGIVLAPDGTHAYAAIAGQVSSNPTLNNDNVARLDVLAGTQVGLGQTELFPEDAAYTVDGTGAVRHVYVTNSTSGSVTCLTPALAPVATIALPTCFGFSEYPFGLLVTPDQNRVFVTTIGFCNDVFAIDSNPASPTFNTIVQSFSIPGAGGRAAWGPYPTMVLPTTTYGADGSQAGFVVVDVTNPAGATSHTLTPAVSMQYASTIECVVTPGNKALLSISYSSAPVVYECSLASGNVLRTLDLSAITDVSLHGLATNPSQTLGAVTSLHGHDTIFFDLATFSVVGSYDHGLGQPNDVVFTPDGSRAVVSLQAVPRVDVLKHVPGYLLRLEAPASVNVGANLTYAIDNCESGQAWALYFSLAGNGPQQIGPHAVALSNPFALGWIGTGDLAGNDSVTFVVPNTAGLPGMTVSTQAVTVDRDGNIRISNGAQTLIN